MTLLELLADAVARIVYAEEALAEGETGIATTVLRDLEADLVAVLEQERAT